MWAAVSSHVFAVMFGLRSIYDRAAHEGFTKRREASAQRFVRHLGAMNFSTSATSLRKSSWFKIGPRLPI
jgi:hypothetical protein